MFDIEGKMTDYNPPKEPQPPIDLSHHYSITAKLRKASPIKEFYKYFQVRRHYPYKRYKVILNLQDTQH